ncbi:hypothetical protein ABPG75_005784 [Micractinium tetrahymenae]
MALSSAAVKGAAVGYAAGVATTLLLLWVNRLLSEEEEERQKPRVHQVWRRVQHRAANGQAQQAQQEQQQGQQAQPGAIRPGRGSSRAAGSSTPSSSKRGAPCSTPGAASAVGQAASQSGSKSCRTAARRLQQQAAPVPDAQRQREGSSRLWTAYWWLQRSLGIWLLAAAVQGSGPAVGQQALLALGTVEAAAAALLLVAPYRGRRALRAVLGAAFAAAFLAMGAAPQQAVPALLAATAAVRAAATSRPMSALVAHAAALRVRILSHCWGLLSCLALEKLSLLLFYSSWLMLTALPQLTLGVASLLSGGQAQLPLLTLLEDLLKSLLYPGSWTGACNAGPASPAL